MTDPTWEVRQLQKLLSDLTYSSAIVHEQLYHYIENEQYIITTDEEVEVPDYVLANADNLAAAKDYFDTLRNKEDKNEL